VRAPGPNFADGLTTFHGGRPDYSKALAQHEMYCAALAQCGVRVIRLEPDLAHPDSAFVEDVAVATSRFAVITRPGADSRREEVEGIREPIERLFGKIHEIQSPGTLDGGDVCQADDHFFIGVSQRTNQEGAEQLAAILARGAYSSTLVDIRKTQGALHLKSEIAYVGERKLVLSQAMATRAEFRDYELLRVAPEEAYAANCVRVNDCVLVAEGFSRVARMLAGEGLKILVIEVSEFRKMDGGLSCLSLRF
jgi:dimethylargininase